MKKIIISAAVTAVTLSGFAQKAWSEKTNGNISIVTNKGGRTLGYSITSGVKLLSIDGYAFKDLNKNGKLDKYEDWRLPVGERAKDLATKMSVEQIAGLMLYSAHQAIPANARGFGAGTYGGKPIDSSGMQPYDISDQQKKFLRDDNLRHVSI